MPELQLLEAYRYDLPSELIAQRPLPNRDDSRLLVIDRQSGRMEDRRFSDLLTILERGDSLVLNNTKVIPARLKGMRSCGGKMELLLVESLQGGRWKALAKPARKLKGGQRIYFSDTFFCDIVDKLDTGEIILSLNDPASLSENLNKHGAIPLPPYIRKGVADEHDNLRYQTVFAAHPGAIAAPTAGLHFTEQLLGDLKKKGVATHEITLHVGAGTFKPVVSQDITKHTMHAESFFISNETAQALNQQLPANKQICVGTTCCRTLEAACDPSRRISPGEGSTDIFITPGYKFQAVKQLLTNFHLPQSTLLMLVCAFAGYDLTMEAYKKAVKERYRFFSYGDAMLIL